MRRALFCIMSLWSCSIQWTSYGFRLAVEHMGIDHCGFNILVTEKFLHGADIISGFQEVSGKAMAEGVQANIFMNSCFDAKQVRNCSISEPPVSFGWRLL